VGYNIKLTMLRNVLYSDLQQKIIITHMHIKQKPIEVITRPSSYFVIPFVLVIFSWLSIANMLLYIPQLAAAQSPSHTKSNPQPTAAEYKETKSNFLIYENPTHKIEIQYPADWKKVEPQGFEANSDQHVVEFKLFSESLLQKEDIAALHIYIHNLPAPNILDQFTRFFGKMIYQKTSLEGFVLSHFTSILTKNLPNFDFIKSESDTTATLAGNPAHKIVYKYSQGQNDIKVMEALTVKDGKGYIIMYTAEATKYSYYLPIIQRMMDSFKIK
jgi:hypothetical protein